MGNLLPFTIVVDVVIVEQIPILNLTNVFIGSPHITQPNFSP